MKHLVLTTALLAMPMAAWAQVPTTAGRGPLVIERTHNHFVVAPDFKVTEIDDDTGRLAGGYGGWLMDDTLLVGGAAYWLVNGPPDARLAYGGLLVGWSTPPERRIQFGARGLVGIGRATLATDVTRLAFDDRFARFGARGGVTGVAVTPVTSVRVRVEDDIFVFEPQLTLVTRFTDHLGITWGAGYRLTGYTEFPDDRLQGATGSIALQWGGWR